MKYSKVILTTSVILNVCLGGLIVLFNSRERPDASPSVEILTQIVMVTNAASPEEQFTTNSAATVQEEFRWSSVVSTNYEEYVANLRSIGCPPETIWDIISGELQEEMIREVEGSIGPLRPQFWHIIANLKANESMLTEKFGAIDKMEKRNRELLSTLLGSRPSKPAPDKFRLAWLDYLSPEKTEQFLALREKFDEQKQEINRQRNGNNREEIQNAINALDEALLFTQKNLLTANEFEEYRLRNSEYAWIRGHDALPEYSREEIRMLVKIQEDFKEAHLTFEGKNGQKNHPRPTAEQTAQLQEQIKSYLGEERYADYARSQDQRFREAFLVTERFELPRESATKVYELRKSAENDAMAIWKDPNLSPDERDGLLDFLVQHTGETIEQTLGKNASASYREKNGRWLQNLGMESPNPPNSP